jgi:Epoxide hydrolase N terminus
MSMPSPRPADTKWDRIAPCPFKIAVPESSLDDLKARLARVRWPDEISGEPWQFGTDLAYLKSLCAYWKDQYDWRAQEAQINLFKQFKVSIGGCELHYICEHDQYHDLLADRRHRLDVLALLRTPARTVDRAG